MSAATTIAIGELMAPRTGSIDPVHHPDEVFDLYSIPAFDIGQPEVIAGNDIGSAKQVVEPGDVLLSRIVPHIRRSWVVGERRGRRMIASGEWIVFRSNRVHPGYLRHVVVGDQFHRQFMRTVSGVGGSLLRARPAYVAAIQIRLPSPPEQRRIAEVLDRADALRAKRRAALDQLDSLTQSLFVDLFGDPVTNPKGWNIEPMGSLFSIKHGFAFKSGYFADAGEFVVLTPGNFYEAGGYRDRGEKQKHYCGPLPDGYILNENDLLVAMTEQAPGLLGSPILIPESNRFLHNQRLGLVQAKTGVERLFLFHLFNTPCVRSQIQASSTGTKVKHTSPGKITAVRVPIPPVPLQREFGRRVAAVEKLKASHRASLAEMDALFASLQHRAFRGEL